MPILLTNNDRQVFFDGNNFIDADEDGYGDEENTVEDCELSTGITLFGGDCDDGLLLGIDIGGEFFKNALLLL